jgi:hypothetical protein
MSSERQNDCYFLEDFNGIPSSCIDQVCLLWIFFSFFIIFMRVNGILKIFFFCVYM